MNMYFREIKVGGEFWCDGRFWVKKCEHTAESEVSLATFKPDETVMVAA